MRNFIVFEIDACDSRVGLQGVCKGLVKESRTGIVSCEYFLILGQCKGLAALGPDAIECKADVGDGLIDL